MNMDDMFANFFGRGRGGGGGRQHFHQ